MIDIGLIFHSATNPNLGVGALTVSDVEIIREAARGLDARITVIDGKGPGEPCVGGPDITIRDVRPLRRPWEFFRIVRGLDVIIDIGGGDSLADIYGRKRFARMHLQKYLVHAARRPLVLAPQTIGPFSSRLFARIAAGSIRRAVLVATRDDKSTRALREMGVRGDIIEASDVALRLPHVAPARDEAGPGQPRVGLNVSGLLINGGYTRDNMFGLTVDYPRLVHAIIGHFRAHADGCEIHLVPHVINPAPDAIEDDLRACRALADEFPGVVVAPAFASPGEAKSYIAGLDFFMGARMHSCVAAFSSGVPVVPMAYSRKFAGLFGSLGYEHTVDCTTEDADTILARIDAAYENRAALAVEVKEALARGLARLRLYEDALRQVLLRVAERAGQHVTPEAAGNVRCRTAEEAGGSGL